MKRASLGIALSILTTGCLGSPGNLPPCDSWNTGHSICRLMNPEDLAVLPNAGWIVISEMTHSDPSDSESATPFQSGRLTAIRLSDHGGEAERRVLYPQEWDEELPATIRWGDPACTGPPTFQDFQPHGLDVGLGPDGQNALAVVTHGAREVVDLFEIAAAGEDPLLEWRGCVPVPVTMNANDVVMVAGGGLLVTNFMPRIEETGYSAFRQLMRIHFGEISGSVLRWQPGGEFVEIPNSEGSAPNGIAASPDGRVVYVAEWGGESVYRLRWPAGSVAGRVGGKLSVPIRDAVEIDGRPDNLTWTADGQLLVAAQKASPFKAFGCTRIRSGGCDVGYSITRIDAEPFEATQIGTGRGAASVALEVGDEIYVGVFTGDSISRVAKPD